jgi:hypothetical protein
MTWYKGHILYRDGQCRASKKTIDTIESDPPVYCRARHCPAMASYKQAEVNDRQYADGRVELSAPQFDVHQAIVLTFDRARLHDFEAALDLQNCLELSFPPRRESGSS